MRTIVQHRTPRQIALAVLALSMSACSVRNEAVPGEVYIDFRGRPLPPEIRVSGPEKAAFIRPEPEGLRVTLPKDRYDLGAVKFDLVTAVKGDCEVTATLDILEAEEPPDELGVGGLIVIAALVAVRRRMRKPVAT